MKRKLPEPRSCLVELQSGAQLRSEPDHVTLNFHEGEDVIELNKADVSKERECNECVCLCLDLVK